MTRLTRMQRHDDTSHGNANVVRTRKLHNHTTTSTDGAKPRNGRMGSCISYRIAAAVDGTTDGDENFLTAAAAPLRSLEDYLVQFSDQKGKLRREEALSVIVRGLNLELNAEFVDKNYAMLLYQCLFCIRKRKGSAKELLLATEAIGLLGMIVQDGDEDCSHKIYEDSLPVLSQALVSYGSNNKSKILDSLAVVTFFGANSAVQIEKAMQIIWKFLKADSDSDNKVGGVMRKHSAGVLASAISAWSFLLTTIEGWRIDLKYWNGAISYLSNLLEETEDESVYTAAAEALALIFETERLDKFLSADRAKDSTDDEEHLFEQELKDNITEKIRSQAMKEFEDVSKQEVMVGVLKFFDTEGESLETYAEIGESELVLSTLSQRIQLNFIRNFLGEDGFVKHMKENKILQSLFEFTPELDNSSGSDALYSPDREEVALHFYQKEYGAMLPFMKKAEKQRLKRMTLSPNSYLNKARTRLLNKKRISSQCNYSDD